MRRATLACGIVVVTTACGSSSDRSARPPVSARTTARLGVDTIASGLDVPWSIAFAPDGRVFITERAGRIRIVDQGILRPEPWATLPVAAQGEAGVATGDARDPSSAQDERSLAGKILRLRRDGSIPDDNPVRGSLVYARGLRNTQGLAWDPATRQMFGSEHGPSGFPNEYFRRDRDELNAIAAGANLGRVAVREYVRPAACRCRWSRRHGVLHDEQPRRPWRAASG